MAVPTHCRAEARNRLQVAAHKAFQVAPNLVVATHFVVSGQTLVKVNDDELRVVRAGELLLLLHNDAHTFGSDLSVSPFSQPDEVKAKSAGGFAERFATLVG